MARPQVSRDLCVPQEALHLEGAWFHRAVVVRPYLFLCTRHDPGLRHAHAFAHYPGKADAPLPRLRHLNRGLKPQRTAYAWPLHTFLPTNKGSLLP